MNDWWAFTRAWKARREAERAVRSLERERWNDMIVVALGVIVIVALIIFGTCPAHAGGDGATDASWAGCDDVARSLAACKKALVPCDSCCGEDSKVGSGPEPRGGLGTKTGGVAQITTAMAARGPDPAGPDPTTDDSTGAVQDAPAAGSGGVVRPVNPPPVQFVTAGTQPSAPDSTIPKRETAADARDGRGLGVQTSGPATARNVVPPMGGGSPEQSAGSWHPAAGLSLLNAAYLGLGGAERRGSPEAKHWYGKANWVLTGAFGRHRMDSTSVPNVVPNHPDDWKNDCEYGCNDVHVEGSRKVGGGSKRLYGATVIVSW